MNGSEEAAAYVTASLEELADPEKAAGMQAYMKTEMPFFGVQKAGRTTVLRQFVKEFQPANRSEYEDLVSTLWALPHREEKYQALGVARHFSGFIAPDSLPLYKRLIVEGAWWDFVDEVATKLIRPLVAAYPAVWEEVDSWIDDNDMWLRRSAIICQIGLKESTDADRLFRFCEARLWEKEFFIRKAIGWALREYAKTDPVAVASFANTHCDAMSGLSFREATKHIKEMVN